METRPTPTQCVYARGEGERGERNGVKGKRKKFKNQDEQKNLIQDISM